MNDALADLRSAYSESTSQSLGSRAVRRTPKLAWNELVKVVGDDSSVVDRLRLLKVSEVNCESSLIALAEKYATGWLPDRRDR